MRTTLALICILAVAAVSAADPIPIVGVALTAEDVGSPAPGFTRYLVYLVGDPTIGDNGALAGGLEGNFLGPMSQIWFPGAWIGAVPTPTPYLNTALQIQGAYDAGAVSAGPDMDSHIAIWFREKDTDPITPITGIFESMPGEDKVPGDVGDVGIGSTLGGTVSWNIPSANLQVAQIVVPDGQQVVFDGIGSFKYQNGEVLNSDTQEMEPNWVYLDNPVTATIGIPEPATLCLLAIGGIGALIRRRR